MRRRVQFRFGPAPEPLRKPNPYTALKKPRVIVPTLRLPSDLSNWYAKHEGIGLGAAGVWPLRLAALVEIQRVRADALGVFPGEPPREWATFEGLRFATGLPAEAIVYVLSAPCFHFGSVVAFGQNVRGPATSPIGQPAGSLVLDLNFLGWATRHDCHDWTEPGLIAGGLDALRKPEAESLRRHYRRLNPGLGW